MVLIWFVNEKANRQNENWKNKTKTISLLVHLCVNIYMNNVFELLYMFVSMVV